MSDRAHGHALPLAQAYSWNIECIEFAPARRPEGGLVGFARFRLPGGLQLNDTRVVRVGSGLLVTFPRRCAMVGGNPAHRSNGDWMLVNAVAFPRDDEFRAFSAAAIAAIRVAFPGALEAAEAAPLSALPARTPAGASAPSSASAAPILIGV